MPLVSVTRLHLASTWSFPGFLLYTLASARQARGSRGFIAGWLGNDPDWGFWTSTVWESSDAMRAFRNRGVHLRAMPKLLRWCDEASFVHWEQPDAIPPSADVAYDRLALEGHLSKVAAPSAQQQAGNKVGRGKPRPGQTLRPR